MSDITLQVSISDDRLVTTLKTVGTAWEDIDMSSLAIVIYGEDKNNPLHTYILTEAQITSIKYDVDGLQAATTSLIPDYKTADNFYIIGLKCIQTDESVILSNSSAIGFIYIITDSFKTISLDVVWSQVNNIDNNKADDIFLNIQQSNCNFIFEKLELLSTLATYGYDRESAWRKLYKVLVSYYG